MTADSLAVAARDTLHEYPGNGAATELVEIVRRYRLVPLIADAALEIGERDPGSDGKAGLVVNARSKCAAVILPARILKSGGVAERVRPIRPATGEIMATAELDASNWRPPDEAVLSTMSLPHRLSHGESFRVVFDRNQLVGESTKIGGGTPVHKRPCFHDSLDNKHMPDHWIVYGEWPGDEAFRRYFKRRFHRVSRRIGIRN